MHFCKIYCNMNDSESDPYESGQNSERSDISDDNDSHQETELHDNSDVISLEAESDGERFDPTEGENSFSLDGSMAAYCQKYFYQHLTEDSIKRNILDAAPVPANAFCTPPKVDDFVEDFIDFNACKCRIKARHLFKSFGSHIRFNTLLTYKENTY